VRPGEQGARPAQAQRWLVPVEVNDPVADARLDNLRALPNLDVAGSLDTAALPSTDHEGAVILDGPRSRGPTLDLNAAPVVQRSLLLPNNPNDGACCNAEAALVRARDHSGSSRLDVEASFEGASHRQFSSRFDVDGPFVSRGELRGLSNDERRTLLAVEQVGRVTHIHECRRARRCRPDSLARHGPVLLVGTPASPGSYLLPRVAIQPKLAALPQLTDSRSIRRLDAMYNLITGAVDGVLSADRLLEGIDDGLNSFLRPDGKVDVQRLQSFPTLLMPERQDENRAQVAQVGNVLNLTMSGRNYTFRFVRNPSIPPIPSEYIESHAAQFGVGAWGFNRTRWTVKALDLHQILLESNLLGFPRPTAFVLPIAPPEPNQIAVMMPFQAEFDPVWSALKDVGEAGGWLCQRADDIWEDSVLVNDIVALIARSKVVICDLTDRNANVFYEAGIAHTLGRDVVLITQSPGDVPFDLQQHRYIKYLRNDEGLAALKESLAGRLNTLMRS
jgi:hypothetical protein